MPNIINAWSGNESIANNLSKISDSMFGNGAQQELIRQNATGKARENTNIPLLAAAARDGDPNAIAYYGAMSNKTGRDAADFNLLARTNHAKGIDDPSVALAQLGAHEGISATPVGQNRSLTNERTIASAHDANARATAQMTTDRQIQQQQWADEHTLVNLRGPDGRITMVPKSQAANLQAHGYDVMPSMDQVKAGILAPQGQPGQEAGAPPAAGVPRTAQLNPDQRSLAGLPTAIQSFQNPTTGEVAISQDAGQTLTRPDGTKVSAVGSGFMPVDHSAALGQAQQNNMRTAAAAPPPAFPDPANSQAAADANKSSGLDAFAQSHLNAVVGATGLGKVTNYLAGTPEVGPDYERARSQQEIRNNEARTALLANPGRQGVQQQKWVNDLLPEGAAMVNPATEAGKVQTIVGALKADLDNERRVIADVNTPAPERIAAVQRTHRIENAIRMFTAPAAGQPGAQPAQPGPTAPLPQQAPPPAAVNMLRQNPQLTDQFDAKYGAGASARILGGQ